MIMIKGCDYFVESIEYYLIKRTGKIQDSCMNKMQLVGEVNILINNDIDMEKALELVKNNYCDLRMDAKYIVIQEIEEGYMGSYQIKDVKIGYFEDKTFIVDEEFSKKYLGDTTWRKTNEVK